MLRERVKVKYVQLNEGYVQSSISLRSHKKAGIEAGFFGYQFDLHIIGS